MVDNKVPEQQVRVFLSYSRKDRDFIDKLAAALTEHGCLVDYDLVESDNVGTGISAEDQWWSRLQDMIAAANVIVFAVSPDSIKSPVCDEEIAYSQALGKRLIPILVRKISFASAPPRLSAYNVKIDFSDIDEQKFQQTLQELIEVINRDVTWVRNATQLIVAAKNWDEAGRPADQLLHGVEIKNAEEIAANRPSSASENPEIFLEYLRASRDAEHERRTIGQIERARYLELVQVMRPFLEEELRIRESASESTHAGVAEEARMLKERVRSLLNLDGKWHPQPAEHKASTGAQQGYAEIFYFPCCNIYVRDFLSTGNYDAPSQLRSDGCLEIPESIKYEYRNPANPFYSSLVGRYHWQNMPIDEYQAKLEKWIDTDNEILIDIYLPRSGTGGTLYLLNSVTQVEQMIESARELADRSNNGKALITCFASITPSKPSFYPVRGKVDKPFIERIRSIWDSERWYSIVSLEDVFPNPLQIIGRGSTQQELKNDLVNLRSNWKGRFIGFGEHPFDSSDWAKRNLAYVLETTVGTPDWKKPGEM